MNEIPQLHKEQCCASCEHLGGYGPFFCRRYKDHRRWVQPWNICPEYEECEDYKSDPSPRSGPWVVRGT